MMDNDNALNVQNGFFNQARKDHTRVTVTMNSGQRITGYVKSFDKFTFLLDTKTRPSRQREGIATEVVRRAAHHTKAAGCEWLHVDFEPHLGAFYFGACGFRPTDAGLVHLYERD